MGQLYQHHRQDHTTVEHTHTYTHTHTQRGQNDKNVVFNIFKCDIYVCMYARTYIHCKNSSPIQSLVLMHLVIVYTVSCNKTQHVLQILGTFLDIRAHNYYNIPPSSSLLPTIIVCGSCSPTQLPKVINPQMYLGHHPQPYLAQYCISGSL